MISLDPSYRSNPYIVDAGLADVEQWPELAQPSSPTPSDDEATKSRAAGRLHGPFGATGLKHTATIYGPSHTGAVGMRVSGKRQSVAGSVRHSVRRSMSQPRPMKDLPNPPVDVDATPKLPSSSSPRKADLPRNPNIEITIHDASPAPRDSEATKAENAAPIPAGGPAPMPLAFIPKFKGAAEMEARRQLRMRSRFPTRAPVRPQQSAPAAINPEISSSSSSSSSEASMDDEEQDVLPDDDDFDDDVDDVDDVQELEDEDVFDP